MPMNHLLRQLSIAALFISFVPIVLLANGFPLSEWPVFAIWAVGVSYSGVCAYFIEE